LGFHAAQAPGGGSLLLARSKWVIPRSKARRQIALFDSADCCRRSERRSASAAIVSSTA
jgi:hypothetical protein